ncbi:putative ribonuclease h protein, partial [Quercus suber]
LKGRDVILKGALWRVGDGNQIRIWGDNWLPSKPAAKISTPILFGQENSCVGVLINPATRSWRNDVIDHVFSIQEAEIIKNIPLSSTNQPDKLIWPFTPSGNYSVKSGYRFLHENAEQSQSSTHVSAYWKEVWSMAVPGKIKNFVWRASREALPVRKNLCRRKITQDGKCEACKEGDEDCSHALFFCSVVQVMWNSDPQWRWIAEMKGRSVKDIFERAFAEKLDAALLAFTSWGVWNRRNKIRFKEAACPLEQLLTLSKDRKTEFHSLQSTVGRQQHRRHTRWKPPDHGTYKINYDGAIFPQQGKAGIGVVVRDEVGAVLASLSQQMPLPTTVAQVEALAARRAVEFALEMGVTIVVIEGDSESICRELQDPSPSLALHGHVLQDAKCLSNSLQSVSFTHVRREGNTVAHGLARWAINWPNLTVWMEDVPPDI